MEKLISICIPTFNRAEHLQRQLAWLAQETKDFGDACEIIVSDNCSEDQTPSIIQNAEREFSHTQFHANRNCENIGWMRNFSYCVNNASGLYTWIIGDDDVIYDGTVAFVIRTLKQRSDLSLLYLNFSDRDGLTGASNALPWFKTDPIDDQIRDGKVIFQKHLQHNIGSVIFISATIFKTQFGQEALLKWQGSQENWAGLAYWNGYCATQGSVLVTHENYLECVVSVSYWQKDPQAWFKIRYFDLPEIYVHLQQLGYSSKFCRQMMLDLLKDELLGQNAKSNLKYYAWCFANSPLKTFQIVLSYINFWMTSVAMSSLGVTLSRS